MRYFLTFCFSLLSSVFFAYSANISGTVTDAATGKPMQSVSVFIAGTTSGVDGAFSLIFYPNGACVHAGNLVTVGYWSFKKVGELLPWDYQPPKTAKQVVTLH